MTSADELSGGGSVWTPTLASLAWRVDLQQPSQLAGANDGNGPSNAAAAQSEPLAIVRLQTRPAASNPVANDSAQPALTSTRVALTRAHCHAMLQQLDAIEAALSSSRDRIAAQHGQTADS